MWERHPRSPQARSTSQPQLLWSVFLVVFISGGLFFGYLFYSSVRDIVAYADIPFFFGGPLNPVHAGAPDDPQPGSVPLPPGRVNVLLAGIDRRQGEPGPWRTDTMILFSLDPISNTASMLSMPRDLWVPMPGYDMQDRINTAAVYGDMYSYPGGGLEYAKQAVQYNLGVPVDYYVRIDFAAFQKVIDAIGGIDVDVPEKIVDPEYPTENYGTMRLVIEAGRQHMNGDLALKYARTRHTTQGGDIGRARRQQQVIMAVRDKALSLNYPLNRVPGLIQTLGESVQTDLSISQILSIAQAAQKVQVKDIKQGVIDETMVVDWMTPDGKMVLLPQRDKIRQLISEIFPVPTKPAASVPLGNPDQLAQEAARIEVQNGTNTTGLASQIAGDLRSTGYNVVRFGNADRFDYAETVLIVYNEKRYSLDSLKAQLHLTDIQVSRQNLPSSDVDIRVILGRNAVSQASH